VGTDKGPGFTVELSPQVVRTFKEWTAGNARSQKAAAAARKALLGLEQSAPKPFPNSDLKTLGKAEGFVLYRLRLGDARLKFKQKGTLVHAYYLGWRSESTYDD